MIFVDSPQYYQYTQQILKKNSPSEGVKWIYFEQIARYFQIIIIFAKENDNT